MVVPDGENEHHGLGKRLAHLGETTLLLEDVGVSKGRLLLAAVVGGDGVAGDAGDLGLGVGDDLAVLDVEALDLGQVSGGVLEELGDDGDLLGRVNGHARAVEGGVALAIAVEVASIGVAGAGVAVSGKGATAVIPSAHGLARGCARVGSVSRADLVGLPDVHLGAARAVRAHTGVGIIAGWGPAFDIGLTIDELEVTRALAVAVACAILGTGLVAGVLGRTTVSVHGHEVDGTVQTAAEVGNIHVEGELVAQQGEHWRRVS